VAAVPTDAPDYRAFFNTDADARRLTRTGLLCYGLLYGHFIAAVSGLLPAWSLAITAPILVVRWLIATHELFHLRDQGQVDLITRLMPLLLTPLSLGYKEFLAIHRGHHGFMATPDDPEYFQIRGRPVMGLLNAMTVPEQGFLRWMLRQPLDAELILGATVRLLLFGAMAGYGGAVFVWYWLPTRIAFGMAHFVFFYCVHRRGGAYGVYPLGLASWQRKAFSAFFGQEALLATCHHDAHHRHPRVSAFRLPDVTLHSDGL
jgi:hypothetical protein